MRPAPGAAALLLLLLSLDAGAASVYKWVDKNGVVHYDDTQTTNSQRLTREYMDKRKIAADPGWTGPIPGRFVADVERQCSNARERLASYRSAAKLFGRDPEGNSYPLSKQQRALMIAETDRDAKRYCAPGAAKKLYAEKLAAQAAELAKPQPRVRR